MRRPAALLLVAAVAACAPMPAAGPDAPQGPGPASVSEAAAPEIAVIGMGERAVLSVTFRGPTPRPVSAGRPAIVRTAAGVIEAPPMGPPSQSVENGSVRVVAASYALSPAQARTLAAPGPGATLEVHDGEAYRSYPFVRTDIME